MSHGGTDLKAPPNVDSARHSLGATAARGALIMLTGQGMRVVLQFASVVVLARLLTPHDYGLIAIVAVIIGIGEIFRDFGLSSAAVRAPELTRGQSTNLFWINTVIGVVLGTALFAMAGPIALWFRQPEVVEVARAMASIFVLNGVATQFRALVVRALRFRWLAFFEVLAPSIALAVAIGAALLNWNYWALVAQQVTQALVLLIGAALGARFVPGLPQRDTSVRPFIALGGNLVLSQVVNYVTNKIDTATVGLAYGAAPLGMYNRAYQLVGTPLTQIQAPITSVALPILSKLQHDQERFSAYIIRGQLALGYPISVGLALIAVVAHPIIEIMLGEKWFDAVPLLQFFALAGIARTLASVGYWVYVVRGLGTSLFKFTTATAVIPIACVIVGAQWGVVGIAAGFAIAPCLKWPLSLLWLSRATTVPTKSLYIGALRIILVAGFSATASHFALIAAPPMPAVAAISVASVASLGSLGLLCIFPHIRADIRALWELAVLVRGHRRA